MREQVADGQRFLAAGRELGPIFRHRGIQIESSLVDQPQRTDRSHALRRREEVHQAVALPGLRALGVRETSVEVDHGLALAGLDRHRDDFIVEAAGLLGGLGLGLGGSGEGVLVFPGS